MIILWKFVSVDAIYGDTEFLKQNNEIIWVI